MSTKHPFDETATCGFVDRHVGPDADAQAKMLAVVGYGSLDDLVAAAVPPSIHDEVGRRSAVPPAATSPHPVCRTLAEPLPPRRTLAAGKLALETAECQARDVTAGGARC